MTVYNVPLTERERLDKWIRSMRDYSSGVDAPTSTLTVTQKAKLIVGKSSLITQDMSR
jgi:hypothetical protein